jgi:hypothetical protein
VAIFKPIVIKVAWDTHPDIAQTASRLWWMIPVFQIRYLNRPTTCAGAIDD